MRGTAHAPETRVTTNGDPQQKKMHAERNWKPPKKIETTNQLHFIDAQPSPPAQRG